LQAKVQLLAMQGELTGLRREEFADRTRLAELMGRSTDDLPRPADALTHEAVHPDWPELARQALQRRPDLKLLRKLIQSAAEDRRVTEAGYFPAVSLVASGLYLPGHKLLYQTTPIIEGQTPYATDGRFGAQLTWQIIDNGAVTGASRRLDGVRWEYAITLRQLEQNIPRELARIAHSLEDADSQLAALNQSVTEADEDLRLIEARIGLGEATQLDFSDAQRDLLAVRHGVVDALYQYNLALAELDWTTGRYLEFAEPAPEH
jgi:outer membrane protein TolC